MTPPDIEHLSLNKDWSLNQIMHALGGHGHNVGLCNDGPTRFALCVEGPTRKTQLLAPVTKILEGFPPTLADRQHRLQVDGFAKLAQIWGWMESNRILWRVCRFDDSAVWIFVNSREIRMRIHALTVGLHSLYKMACAEGFIDEDGEN